MSFVISRPPHGDGKHKFLFSRIFAPKKKNPSNVPSFTWTRFPNSTFYNAHVTVLGGVDAAKLKVVQMLVNIENSHLSLLFHAGFTTAKFPEPVHQKVWTITIWARLSLCVRRGAGKVKGQMWANQKYFLPLIQTCGKFPKYAVFYSFKKLNGQNFKMFYFWNNFDNVTEDIV